MKRLLILALLFALTPMYAHAVSGEFAIGKYFGVTRYASQPANSDGALWLAELHVWEKWGDFTPSVGVETIMDKNDGLSFHPSSVKYFVGLEYEPYDNIVLEIEHMCWHPVDSDGVVEQYNIMKLKYRWD